MGPGLRSAPPVATEAWVERFQRRRWKGDRNGCITLDNIRMALTREATDAMKESRVQDILVSLSALQYRRMEFQEFCAAAVSVHQLEALDRWEQHARSAYEHFEKEGN
uniref:Uncharacterized protein n=1 Tax=Zea mays TaxID=4577 RepID=A0A804P3V8_MAIZE